jgi:hypothetical protein
MAAVTPVVPSLLTAELCVVAPRAVCVRVCVRVVAAVEARSKSGEWVVERKAGQFRRWSRAGLQ